MKQNPLYEQFERDVAERKAMNAAWVEFLDVLTGHVRAPKLDVLEMLTDCGLEVSDEALDHEEALESEEDDNEPDDDPWADGTFRDGARRYERSRRP